MMKYDLHLISSALLLNLGMMMHRMALRQQMSNTDDTLPTTATSHERDWIRASKLYELLLSLFHKEPDTDRSSDICSMPFYYYHIRGMRMMKMIVYNNYAQICYEMGRYHQYYTCILLLQEQIRLDWTHEDDDSSSTSSDTATTTSVTTATMAAVVAVHYKHIRHTIQVNAWICQLLSIPVVARAA